MSDGIYPHPAAWPDERLTLDCRMERIRGGGPGGQRRNKVQTGVRFVHVPSGLIGQATEDRRPEVNRKRAWRRLRIRLALQIREPVDPHTYRASSALQSRRRDGRIELNPRHRDYPAILAEVLDVVAACRFDLAAAAANLEVSTSQVLKLLKHEPEALEAVNRERQQFGRPPYR